MEPPNAQLEVALWLLSDMANSFVKRKTERKFSDIVETILNDPRNTFSFTEVMLAATEVFLEENNISDWFYNTVGEWINDVAGLWLETPDYYTAKVMVRSREAHKFKISFFLGRKDDEPGAVPVTKEQFESEIITKQIRFYRFLL